MRNPITVHHAVQTVEEPGSDEALPLVERSNLSRSQLMIWTGQALNPAVPLYNMIYRFDLHGAIDPDRFRAAFQALVDRTDAMRTVFSEDDGVPVQRVRESLPYRLERVDLSGEDAPRKALEEWIRGRGRRMLDLGVCTFDSALLKVGPEHYTWYLNQHHLTIDAWSGTLVFRNMADLYGRLAAGEAPPDDDYPSYSDYLAHERALRGSPAHESATEYWKTLAGKAPPRARLYGREARDRIGRTERIACPLGTERSRRLRELAGTPGIRTLSLHMTLFNLFATALTAYLWRVSGSQDLVIGTPAHNRSSRAFRETAGLFIELFPLRVEVDEEDSFQSLLGKVGASAQRFLRNAVPGTSTLTGMRLFNVVLNYIHASFGDFAGIPARQEWVHNGYGDPEHELRLQVHDMEDTGEFTLYFDLNGETFPVDLRERMVDHFLALLDAAVADPQRPLSAIGLTTGAERQRWVVGYNRPAGKAEPGATVLESFRAQVARDPAAVALVQGDRSMSYGELDARSDRLARRLRDRGAGPGGIVGILADRSIELVAGVLAVLKSGAAYVPLESGLPERRLEFILEDTGAELVLARSHLGGRIRGTGVTVVDLDGDPPAPEGAEGAVDSPEPAVPDPGQTAYVIYTSGSTGTPKGVVVDHGGLAGYVDWAWKTFAGGEAADFPLYSQIGFDLTVTSIFVPLISGGAVVIYPEGEGRDALAVLDVFEEDRVDVVKLTPAHLRLVLEAGLTPSRIGTLILGGEDLKAGLAERMVRRSDGRITVFNEYGPTEAVVGCMVHRFDPARDQAGSVPIGVPAAGVRIYVLDEGSNPVPAGVAGELCIGGSRLARGYLNLEEETAARFVDDPFVDGGRMYRTGDRARFRDDGLLEFLGRDDDQVKVRGVRVELGEVEHAVLEHPAVREAVVNVLRTERPQPESEPTYCVRCGLASNYPGARMDEAGLCNVCRDFEGYRARADAYFGSLDELRGVFEEARERQAGPYDCMLLLSGGKDSTYALYQVARIARRVLVVTLDNGYISDSAKANIDRVVSELGVEHRYLTTPAMNEIFVDSLKRHSNVCQGCFKALYTLALQTARDEGIPLIVTGLSRGQLFETRLTPELFEETGFDVDAIDRMVLDARKAYHRVDDAVKRLLDVEMFQDDRIFEQVRFVDFYRYTDVSLDELYAFIDEYVPWIRPDDTGRSTNCLINDVGIYVHKRKEGFHNYALPYSWDVRLGHKERDAALDELDDRIDVGRVQEILDEIGYEEDVHATSEVRMTAYFVADGQPSAAELRAFLETRLPEAMIPTDFVQLESIPLTSHGKVDREALPAPRQGRPAIEGIYRAPATRLEVHLTRIWREILRAPRVGLDDNFFDLGGDSIKAIQVVSRATAEGIDLTPQDVFRHQTVAELAAWAETRPGTGSARARPEAEDRDTGGGSADANLDEGELDKLAAILNKTRSS
ncbi:MAG: amino acid adenylation domain-containing protein [Gemmatimonadota bacterium]